MRSAVWDAEPWESERREKRKFSFHQCGMCGLNSCLHAAPKKISKGRHTIKCHSLTSGQRTSWSTSTGPLWGWHIPHGLPGHHCYWPPPHQPGLQPPHFWGRRSPQIKCNNWYSFQAIDFNPSAKSQVEALSFLCQKFYMGISTVKPCKYSHKENLFLGEPEMVGETRNLETISTLCLCLSVILLQNHQFCSLE